MKIAFIGKFNEIHHEEGKALSLERLDHTVYRFDETTFNNDTLLNNTNSLLSLSPDVVIFTKLRIPNSIEFIRTMKANNILTVSWFPDYCNAGQWENTSFKMNDLQNCPIANSDLVLTPDNTNTTKWKALGVNQQCVRQAIYDECCYKGIKTKQFDADILFVGSVNNSLYKYRIKIIEFLKTTYGNKFIHYGMSNDMNLRGNDLNNAIASVKIVIGDSVYAPEYWSNRIYETIGRGGFCIHSSTIGLDKEYEIGKHFDIYTTNDLNSLKEKIDYYLKEDDLRNTISNEGMKYTKQNHTLLNRSKQVIDIISKEKLKRTWFNG